MHHTPLSHQLQCTLSKAVGGSVHVPMQLLPVVGDTFHASTKFAIYALRAFLVLFPYGSVGTSPLWHLAVFRYFCMSIRHPSSRAALWHLKACFSARHMPLTGAEGARGRPPPLRRTEPYPMIWGFRWAMLPARTLSAAHSEAHPALFDRGFAGHDVAHDETRTGRRIQAGEQVERFRSVYIPVARNRDAFPTGNGPCND
jgi:hypothetical protein